MRGSLRLIVLGLVIACLSLACEPPPAPAVTAPPEPADAVPWPDVVWTEATIEPPVERRPGASEHLIAVAASDAGYVAVGYTEVLGRRDALVLVSDDGAAWDRVAVPAVLRDLDLVDVTAGPGGFVAVGSESAPAAPGPVAVVLRSADGRVWERSPLADGAGTYPYSLAGAPVGYLVAGAAADGGAAAWTSVDGDAWERIPADAFGAASSGLADPTWDGDEWLAVGAASGPPAVVRSRDGTGWTATVIESGTETYPARLVRGRWGLLVGGGEGSCGPFGSCPSAPVHWWSEDGATWTRLPDRPALASGGAVLIEAGEHGFVALDGASAWASTTGWDWTPLPEPGDGSAVVTAAVTRGDVIVAVGDLTLEGGATIARIVVAAPPE